LNFGLMNLFDMGGSHNEHYGESGITRPVQPAPPAPGGSSGGSSGAPSGVPSEAPSRAPYDSVEAALADGRTQEEVDAYLAN
jgi:hypothetical protein